MLGVLRYLGHGAKLDDMEENTAFSEETHRLFLHASNMLLEADGMNDDWIGSSESDYVTRLGNNTGRNVNRNLRIDIDATGVLNDEPIPVRSLTLSSFRERLVEHFDIMWRANQVKWPTRNKGKN